MWLISNSTLVSLKPESTRIEHQPRMLFIWYYFHDSTSGRSAVKDCQKKLTSLEDVGSTFEFNASFATADTDKQIYEQKFKETCKLASAVQETLRIGKLLIFESQAYLKNVTTGKEDALIM